MAVGRSCFRGARKFAQFQRIRNLGPESTSLIIDVDTGAVSKPKADLAALCRGYCWLWVQQARLNGSCISDLARATPAPAKGMKLAYEATPMDMGMTLVVLLSKAAIKTCLDAYAAQGGSFVILTVTRAGWTHAIAIKLKRRSAGPDAVTANRCAIFDPNVGQGVYTDHDDLAGDLLSLIQAYGMLSSIRAHVVVHQSEANTAA